MPWRSDRSLSRTNISPWLGAAPLKLKPATANDVATSGCFIRIASACRAMFDVYSSEAPDGPWRITMK
ncbi:hypothetical protein D3C83_323750 [compost metagenome]